MVNKKNRSFIIFLVSVNTMFMCSSHKDNNVDGPTYELLNDFFARKEIPCFCKYKYIDDQFALLDIPKEDLQKLKKMDSIFNEDDVDYISEQFARTSKAKIIKERIASPNVISVAEMGNKSQKEFWEKFENKYHQNVYSSVSKPLFSKDHQKAVISSRSHTTDGPSWGAVYIFVKKNNTWTPVVQWMMYED